MNEKLEISMNEVSHYESLKKQDLEHRKLIKKLQLEIKALKQGQSLPIHNFMPSLFKERRLKLNLSMQDVTDQTDISKATISRIERGNDAFFDTVMKLDKFYTDNGV